MAKSFIRTFSAVLLITLLISADNSLATDFVQCFKDKVLTSNNTSGWTRTFDLSLNNLSGTDPKRSWGISVNNSMGVSLKDSMGVPVNNSRRVPLAISYDRCKSDCTSQSESFNFSEFSRKFTTWLIPWLALISQLPYGTHNFVDNLLSALYAVGSPCLAGYSLTLTVLNERWLSIRIKDIPGGIRVRGKDYSQTVEKVLGRLQQSALIIKNDHQQLTLLVTSPHGHLWWEKMEKSLSYSQTWTISAVTNLAWVFVAYVLTVADALKGLWTYSDTFGLGNGTYPDSHSDGQAVGGIWLWLFPVVIGWLWVSPKCDCEANSDALNEADKAFRDATALDYRELQELGRVNVPAELHAIELSGRTGLLSRDHDERCSAPIFNYARSKLWTQAVETVLEEFPLAFQNGLGFEDVPGQRPGCIRKLWDKLWEILIQQRYLVASFAGLALQLGTAWGAIYPVYKTPTVGIGCRSLTWLFYTGVSIVIWMLFVASSFLSHPGPYQRKRRVSIFCALAQILVVLNTFLLIGSSLAHFSRAYKNCSCNSSVIGLRSKAHLTFWAGDHDVGLLKRDWKIGVAVGIATAVVFPFFLALVSGKLLQCYVAVKSWFGRLLFDAAVFLIFYGAPCVWKD